MSARTELVEILRPALPAGWDVLPYARQLENLTTQTVMVETTRIEQGAAGGLWSATTYVYVVAQYEDPGKVEDALEEAVELVLNALDAAIPGSINLGADRVTYMERHPAYRCQITYPLQKTQEA